jgi:hypothetical protein
MKLKQKLILLLEYDRMNEQQLMQGIFEYAELEGVAKDVLLSSTLKHEVATIRQAGMILLHLNGMIQKRSARTFNKDHSTLVCAMNKLLKEIDSQHIKGCYTPILDNICGIIWYAENRVTNIFCNESEFKIQVA